MMKQCWAPIRRSAALRINNRRAYSRCISSADNRLVLRGEGVRQTREVFVANEQCSLLAMTIETRGSLVSLFMMNWNETRDIGLSMDAELPARIRDGIGTAEGVFTDELSSSSRRSAKKHRRSWQAEKRRENHKISDIFRQFPEKKSRRETRTETQLYSSVSSS